MLPLSYTETGPYDTALDLHIDPDGNWEAAGGSYVSFRRTGHLAPAELRHITDALGRLAPGDGSSPDGDFPRTLAWAAGTLRWQGPAPTDDPALATVLTLLRSLQAP